MSRSSPPRTTWLLDHLPWEADLPGAHVYVACEACGRPLQLGSSVKGEEDLTICVACHLLRYASKRN